MSGLIAAGVALSVGSGLSAMMGYNADSAKSKAQRQWQTYSNAMKDLSATQSQNAVTSNQLLLSDSFASRAFQLKKESLFTQGRVEVSAAAAGVKGKSVNRTMREVLGNFAGREADRQEAFRVGLMGMDQQRREIQVSAAMSQDYSYIPKPNAASYYLGAAVQTGNRLMSMGGGGAK